MLCTEKKSQNSFAEGRLHSLSVFLDSVTQCTMPPLLGHLFLSCYLYILSILYHLSLFSLSVYPYVIRYHDFLSYFVFFILFLILYMYEYLSDCCPLLCFRLVLTPGCMPRSSSTTTPDPATISVSTGTLLKVSQHFYFC